MVKMAEDAKVFHYLGCPFCGRTYLADKVKKSALENFDISWEVLQAREQHAGPGRKHKIKGHDYGFKLVPKECLTIQEMLADPQWAPLGKMVVNRIATIHGAYKKAGLVNE